MSRFFFPLSSCSFTFADEADADGLPIASTSYYSCVFHRTGLPIDAKINSARSIILLDAIGEVFITNTSVISQNERVYEVQKGHL